MAENIEAFVKKLQSEGVEAGRKAAESIETDARKKAEEILDRAHAEAETVLEQARKEAKDILSRGQAGLHLAARDTLLKLQEALNQALSRLLERAVEERLSQPDFLGEIIREVVLAYARADAKGQHSLEIHVPETMKDRLQDLALGKLAGGLKEAGSKPRVVADLQDKGFEYRVREASVEVSTESVAALLSEMVSPALQEIIQKQMSDVGSKAVTQRTEQKGTES